MAVTIAASVLALSVTLVMAGSQESKEPRGLEGIAFVCRDDAGKAALILGKARHECRFVWERGRHQVGAVGHALPTGSSTQASLILMR